MPPVMTPPNPMTSPTAPIPAAQTRPMRGRGVPMSRPGPLMPLQDASEMQRQAVIKMLQAQGPSPGGGPPQFTMPRPFAPPYASGRGNY